MSFPLSVRLQQLQSLAAVARSALPLGLNAIYQTDDGVLAIPERDHPSRVRFLVEGLPFNIAVSPHAIEDADGTVCQIWAEIGFVPYSVQSPERRRAVLTILRHAGALVHARFVIDGRQRILLTSEQRRIEGMTPDDVIHQAVLMVLQGRPYLHLLAEYL